MNIAARFGEVVLTAFLLAALPANAAQITIIVGNNFFDPPSSVVAPISINLGDTVTWTWAAGSANHNVICGDPSLPLPSSPDPRCGYSNRSNLSVTTNAPFSFSFTYHTAGMYQFYCDPHRFSGMTGAIRVFGGNTPPTFTSGNGDTINYNENAGPVVIGNGIQFTDSGGVLAGATVSIDAGFQSSEDSLIFTDQNGITGSYNSGTGVLTLGGTAVVANYQTALQSIKFQNNSDNPATENRILFFTITDGSLSSTPITRTVNVIAVNDAPILGGTGGQFTYTEGTNATVIDSGITISDADNSTLLFATITISANYVNGEDMLQFTDQLGITGESFDTGTATLTLSGSSSVANYQTALRTVKYLNTSGNPNTATRTVSFQVSDGAAQGFVTNRNIAITAVNNAPTVAITNHASSTHAVIGGDLSLRVAVFDADSAVSNVELFQSATSLGLLSTAPYNFTVTNLAAGVFNFTVVATDSQAAKSTSSVVQVTTGNLALLTNSPPQFTGGQFQFQFTSVGGTFAVQVSTNLVDWVTLTTTPSSPGTQTVNDTPTGQQLRFYRIITVPQP